MIRCGALVTGADLPFIHAFLITCHMVGLRHCMDEVNQGSPLDCKKADREHHAIGRPSCVPGGRHAAAARARGVFGVYVCSLLQGLKAPEDNKLKMRTTKSKRDDGPESRPVQTCPDPVETIYRLRFRPWSRIPLLGGGVDTRCLHEQSRYWMKAVAKPTV